MKNSMIPCGTFWWHVLQELHARDRRSLELQSHATCTEVAETHSQLAVFMSAFVTTCEHDLSLRLVRDIIFHLVGFSLKS